MSVWSIIWKIISSRPFLWLFGFGVGLSMGHDFNVNAWDDPFINEGTSLFYYGTTFVIGIVGALIGEGIYRIFNQ